MAKEKVVCRFCEIEMIEVGEIYCITFKRSKNVKSSNLHQCPKCKVVQIVIEEESKQ